MEQPPTIRQAVEDDANGVATVHVTSWQTAYRGLIPDAWLDQLSLGDRAERWRQLLSNPVDGRTIVAERDGQILGWASFGPGRDPEQGDEGELWGLYVLPSVASTGVGHALITAAESALLDEGFSSAYLWVLDHNDRAANFYERHGWLADGTHKRDERGSLTLIEWRRSKTLR